jgi:hypothetical protein
MDMAQLKTKIKEKLVKQAQDPGMLGHIRSGLGQTFSPGLDYMAGVQQGNTPEQIWQTVKSDPGRYSPQELRRYSDAALKARLARMGKYAVGVPLGLAGAYHLGIPAARAGLEAGGDLLSAGKNIATGDYSAASESLADFAEPGFVAPALGGMAGLAGGAGLGHALSRGKPWGSRLGGISGALGGAALGSMAGGAS